MKFSWKFSVREGYEGLSRGTFHSFIAFTAVALAGCAVGMLIYGVLNLKKAADNLLDNLQIQAFVALSVPDSRHQELFDNLQNLDSRWQINYLSREAAAAKFASEFDSELFNVLKENPLPASFYIDLPVEVMHPDSLIPIAKRLLNVDGIDDVIYDKDLLSLVHAGMQKLTFWGSLVAIIAVILAVGMTFNAIRLRIQAQQEAMNLMSLLGASTTELNIIYLLQGAILGSMGGLISTLALMGIALLIRVRIANGLEITLPYIYLLVMGGGLLGVLGSYLAVKKHLRV